MCSYAFARVRNAVFVNCVDCERLADATCIGMHKGSMHNDAQRCIRTDAQMGSPSGCIVEREAVVEQVIGQVLA